LCDSVHFAIWPHEPNHAHLVVVTVHVDFYLHESQLMSNDVIIVISGWWRHRQLLLQLLLLGKHNI